MKTIILYDSQFGNTERIAQSIAQGMRIKSEPGIFRVGDFKLETLTGVDLLVVGSPTQGFRPTKAIKGFLEKIPENGLKGVKVAAFDTRIAPEDIDSKVGRFFVGHFGYAANPIAEKLKKKGGNLIVAPQGFFVKATEGPLKEGEVERAEAWGKQLWSI